jgi:hypothetical protein
MCDYPTKKKTEFFSQSSYSKAEKQRRHYIIAGRKNVVFNWFGGNPHATHDWPLVEVALLLIGLVHISFEKKTVLTFDPLERDQSFLGREQRDNN